MTHARSREVLGFVSFTLIALFCIFAAGCRSSQPNNTVEVWTISLQPLFTSYMEQVIQSWETQHPGLHVKWVDLPIDVIQQKLIVALASGHPPSVVNLNSSLVNQFSQMGVLQDLNQTVSPEQRSLYFPGFWNSHAVPWYVSTQVVMYNANLFKQAGLDPDKPPATWNDLIQDATVMKHETGVYGWLPAIKFLDDLQEQGIPVISPDGKHALFDQLAAVALLNRYVSLFKQGILPRETLLLAAAYQQAVDFYQAGRLGMLITGPQFLNRVRDNAPSVYAVTRVAPLPLGSGNVTGAAVMDLAIPKSAPLQKEAIDFVLYLTNDENQLRFSEMVPVFPSTVKASRNAFFMSSQGDPLMAKARRIGTLELKHSRDLTLSLKNEKDRNEAIQDAVVNALLGNKTPYQALHDAAVLWDNLLR